MSLSTLVESQWQRKSWLWLLMIPLSMLYSVIVILRRCCYKLGLFKSYVPKVPVVIIGNIYVGGVGKTPFAIWLIRFLERHGYTVALVSRGYGGQSNDYPVVVNEYSDANEVGDEPLLIHQQTNALTVVDPDRVRAVHKIEETVDVDFILADDGLQHYQLGRSAEIMISDGKRKFGNCWCLPAGPLREPVSRVNSCDLHIIAGGSEPNCHVSRDLGSPYNLRTGAVGDWAELDGSVVVITAISHPERFVEMIEARGKEVRLVALPDHESIPVELLMNHQDRPILMTQKDAVKLSSESVPKNVYVCPLSLNASPDTERQLLALFQGL